jgi:hypothetical protein
LVPDFMPAWQSMLQLFTQALAELGHISEKTAAAIGVTVPRAMLMRADRVIA